MTGLCSLVGDLTGHGCVLIGKPTKVRDQNSHSLCPQQTFLQVLSRGWRGGVEWLRGTGHSAIDTVHRTRCLPAKCVASFVFRGLGTLP